MTDTRLTIQRTKILEYVNESKAHPSAEQIYNIVRKDLPSISLATVYRNLNYLVGQGLIFKFEYNNEAHFDGDSSFHQHFICNSCGKVIDIFQKEISMYAMRKLKDKDLKPDFVSIIFRGKCNNCKGDINE